MSDMKFIMISAIGVLISCIFSIVTAFLMLIFAPILNSTAFIAKRNINGSGVYVGTTYSKAYPLLQTVYPILVILIPLFTLIAGVGITIFIATKMKK